MAVLVAAIMVVAMTVPAWAAGASDSGRMTDGAVGKITISNYDTNETYYAYKILDLASFEDGKVNGTDENNANALLEDNHLTDAYAYVIKDESPWEDFVDNIAYNGVKYFVKSSTAITLKNVSGSYYIVTANPALTGFNNLFNNLHTADETSNEEYTTASVVQYLAQQAYAYATNDSTSTVTTSDTIKTTLAGTDYRKTAVDGIITGLGLGYYLVNSTTGSLCALDTTNKNVIVKEKNRKPSVDKLVQEDSGADVVDGDLIHSYVAQNDADMGQDVYFKHLITVKKGAQNYILHDKMEEGLTFVPSSLVVWFLPNGALESDKEGATPWVNLTTLTSALPLNTSTDLKSTNGTPVNNYPYNPTTGAAVPLAADQADFYTLDNTSSVKYYGGISGTFNLTFTPAFLTFLSDKMSDSVNSYRLVVGYKAVLNSKATVDRTGANYNKVWLQYGENESGKPETASTNEATTYTATWSTQILKYTGRIDNTTDTPTTTETVLDGGHFEIYRGDSSTPLKFVKDSVGNYIYDARVQSVDVAAGSTAEEIKEATDSEARDGNHGAWKVVTTLTTSSGILNVKGLDGDKYYLKETLAPKGYNQLEGRIPFRIVSVTEAADGALGTPGALAVTYNTSTPTAIASAGYVAWSDVGGDHSNPYDTLAVSINAGGSSMPKQIKVENTTSTELPSTGGMGTTVLYIVGGMLVILAGAYLFFSRKKTA